MKLRANPTILTMVACTAILVGQPKQANAFGEFAVVAAISALQKFTGSALSSMTSKLTSSITDSLTSLANPLSLTSILSKGFTQQANYSKAQVSAQQRIADASNTAMAGFMKRQEDAKIRDEHMMSPEMCAGLNSQMATSAAAKASRTASNAIATITDPRGEAGPGTPSYYGKSQGIASSMALHARRYCSHDDVSAGLCTAPSTLENADQRAISIFGHDTLTADGGVDAANDYSTMLIQPVAPAAMRGDQMTSTAGRQAALRRNSYNARMSLARYVMNFITTLEIPSVSTNAVQQAEMQSEGLASTDRVSWLQAMSLEANRRVSGVAWNLSLQKMPPATVQREIAIEQAQANYLALQTYRLQLFQASLLATTVAQHEEQTAGSQVNGLPSPNLATGQ